MARVLVVDDDRALQAILADVLTGEGHDVVIAGHGQEALAALCVAPRPDVIFTDLMMPVLDGWGFIERCRELPDFRSIPFVVISAATAVPNASDRLQALGVRECISKPFELDALLGAVDRYSARGAIPAYCSVG